MPDLIIRRIPEHIHIQLKVRAERNHRSMNMEVLALLEEAIAKTPQLTTEPPAPFVGRFPITDDWLRQAREEGRP